MGEPGDRTVANPEICGCTGKYGAFAPSSTSPPHGPWSCGCTGYRGQRHGDVWTQCDALFESPFTDPPNGMVRCGHDRGMHIIDP